MHLNENVKAYNAKAREVLLTGSAPLVRHSVDMYKVVTNVCGEPPYAKDGTGKRGPTNCSLINDGEEYHYNAQGYTLLATAVSGLFKTMLATVRNSSSESVASPERSAGSGSGVVCADNVTHCPASSTCAKVSTRNIAGPFARD
jgi:hypothetical protein